VIRIAPSLLAADFLALGEAAESAMIAGAALLHVDIMDGLFVPNFGLSPDHIRALRPLADRYGAKLGAHLMILYPERYLDAFRGAGADLIFIHQEAGPHAHRTLCRIRALGMRAGITINPGTSLAAIEELLGAADEALVMGVEPGFGGQEFLPETLERIRRIREISETLRISVDGGVSTENIGAIARAGADVAVAGSAVFGLKAGIAASLQALRDAAGPVTSTT
jgi:ribulose-phosphate 3-epimerase